MKVAIMQPYFFPYLGYFSLIKHTDLYILLDLVQYIKGGWINRNRILDLNGTWQYITVPLQKYHSDAIIKDVRICNDNNWSKKILSQLKCYHRAPYYNGVLNAIQPILTSNYSSISLLNYYSLQIICQYLGIKTEIKVLSQLDLQFKKPNSADEWSLNICQALGNVAEYWNPPGGQSFFDRSKYEQAGIKLRFQSINLKEYDQRRKPFEPGLSIIDAMMFNSPEEINQMLDDFELL